QPSAQVAFRYLERKTGAIPPESVGKTCGLLRTVCYRGGPGIKTPSVRTPQENGPRAFQTFHLQPPRAGRTLLYHQGGQGNGGTTGSPCVGHPGGGNPGTPSAVESRPYPPPL